MRHAPALALLTALALALPFTALALLASAAWIEAGPALRLSLGPLAAEAWLRSPEIAGMVVGQVVLMLLVVLARTPQRAPRTA